MWTLAEAPILLPIPAQMLQLHYRLLAPLAILCASKNACFCSASSKESESSEREGRLRDAVPDYLIVGAGGGGIQAALLLQKYNHSYTILEKSSKVGSFWSHYPVFGELISVNKKVKNATQQWKFDWHSMLEAPLSMRDITSDYFPQGKDWQRYMTRVVEEANITVEYGAEISRVVDDGNPCVILVDGTRKCARYRVLLGTGMKERAQPLLDALGGIRYSQMTREAAREKTVCILGNGNAAYETAQNVYDIADRVILYGKHPVRLSSITRYTGDVRVKFLQPTENFHAKLLDTIDHFAHPMKFQGLEKILNTRQVNEIVDASTAATFAESFKCELLVLATGFQSHVPGLHLSDRFPKSGDWYVSDQNPAVHYIGWLMHERDFRRGAGGFLSGYRYLIRNLVHHINEADHGIPYPRLTLTKEEVVAHVINRIQVVDDLVILQDGVLLRDAIIPMYDGTDYYEYYEGITIPFEDIKDRKDVIFLYFSWGNGRRASNVFESVLRYTDTGRLINLFLHPTIETNGLVRDTHEDIEMIWNHPASQSANEITIRAALEKNFDKFRSKESATFPYIPAQLNQTEHLNPHHFEQADWTVDLPEDLVKLMLESVMHGHRSEDIVNIRKFVKGWAPMLSDELSDHASESFCDTS